MAMFVLCQYIYIAIIMMSMAEVHGLELTSDVVYEMLSNRLETLEVETFSMKLTFNDRLDQMESLIRSQFRANTDTKTSDEQNKDVDLGKLYEAKETILNALSSEKIFIRNSLTAYEEQFTQLQTSVIANMDLMNESNERMLSSQQNEIIETSKRLERRIKETETNQSSQQNEIIETSKRLERRIEETETNMRIQASDINGVKRRLTSAEGTQASDINGVRRRLTSLEGKQAGFMSSVEGTVRALENKHVSDIRGVKGRVTSLEDKRVGFTAQLTKPLDKYGENKIIVFDHVLSSYSGGYDSSTGRFTAPRSGLYLFQYNVEAYGSQTVHVVLYVNGNFKTSTTVGKGDDMTGSNAAIGYLSTGQQAYVRTANFDKTYGIYAYRTSFTGVLIN